MLNIDKLRYDYDLPFHHLMEYMECIDDPKYDGYKWFNKFNIWYILVDNKNKIVWVEEIMLNYIEKAFEINENDALIYTRFLMKRYNGIDYKIKENYWSGNH